MKFLILLYVLSLTSFSAMAETILCTGTTNHPNMTALNFEIQIQGKPDKDFPTQIRYKSTIRLAMPDGSHQIQGIDLSAPPKLGLNKITYGGQTAKLELSFAPDNSLQSSVLNSSLAVNLPVVCTIQGKLPTKPVCALDPDKNKSLLAAIFSGNNDLVQTTIECGANVNEADKNGCTPIMFAIDSSCGVAGEKYVSSFGSPKYIIDSLISNGAFVNVTDKVGDTPLIKAAKLNLRDVYDSFIAAEADFNAQDSKGNSALMYAVFNSNGDSWNTQSILEGNPDRRIKNKAGQTAFDIAKHWQRESVIDLVKIPDITVDIVGQADGSCSPLKIEVKQGQVIEIALKATASKMFRFLSTSLNLDLMADYGTTKKQIITADPSGKFSFSCGFHGSNSVSIGEITVK